MSTVYEDEDSETKPGKSQVMWILLGSVAFIALVIFIFLIFRILWRRLQHQKIRKDTPQKPLTLNRKPTPAVKSPIPGLPGAPHYLKKSPSPTGQSPSSGRETPSPTGGQYRDSPTSEETSGPSLAEETSSNASVHIEDETANPDAKRMLCDRVTTSQEILTGSLGQLFFSIRYRKEKLALIVSVIKCLNLPAKDAHSSADPYIKLQLLPDKTNKVKTRVMRKTRNPVYDEDFSFLGIEASQLQSLTLHFVVLTFDRYSRDEIIGEIFFPLKSIDIVNQQENTNITFQKDIQPRSMKAKNLGRGELLVSLCWQPAANRLTVVILKARNLPKMDVTGLADPYVKMYVLYKSQRIAKKKTHVKKRTLNPVFNESFVFEIPPGNDGLRNISVELWLLDWDRVTKNEVIGRLDLGAKGEVESAKHHWSEISKSPRRQIADWHKLYL